MSQSLSSMKITVFFLFLIVLVYISLVIYIGTESNWLFCFAHIVLAANYIPLSFLFVVLFFVWISITVMCCCRFIYMVIWYAFVCDSIENVCLFPFWFWIPEFYLNFFLLTFIHIKFFFAWILIHHPHVTWLLLPFFS